MPASNAVSGVGTEFRRWDGAAWVKIAEILTLDGPDKKRETIDVTNLDSDSGYREFIAGFRDGGAVKMSMNFTRDGYDLMNDDFESDTRQNYEIALPDADNTTFSFLGLVTELPMKISGDKAIINDVTIKVSGAITMNSGSGPAPV